MLDSFLWYVHLFTELLFVIIFLDSESTVVTCD